jgi:hypothetical protein
MVDALEEIHRVLAPRGILVDARPDSRVPTLAELRNKRSFQRFGLIGTHKLELSMDRSSDLAIAAVVRNGLFRRRRAGRFFYRVPFETLTDLREYLWEHGRFMRRVKWIVDAKTRRLHANQPFVMRRGVRFDILERVNRDRR